MNEVQIFFPQAFNRFDVRHWLAAHGISMERLGLYGGQWNWRGIPPRPAYQTPVRRQLFQPSTFNLQPSAQ